MSFLEIFGLIFLAVIVLNVVIGVFAMKAAAADEEDQAKVAAYNHSNYKVIVHN